MTQTDVTASRVIGSIYQNLSPRPLFLNISMYISVLGDTNSILTGVVSPPTVYQCAESQDAGLASTMVMSAIVLPLQYYKLLNGSGNSSISAWVETV